MNRVRVYRSGAVTPPAQRGVEAAAFADVDALRPAGHPTRTQGIFAAPQIEGAVRWVRANANMGFADYAPREIEIDADTAMVYRLTDWEESSSYHTYSRRTFADYARVYFTNAMTLTEWLRKNADLPEQYKATEWEVIFHADAVLNVRNVEVERLAEVCSTDYLRREMYRVLGSAKTVVAT